MSIRVVNKNNYEKREDEVEVYIGRPSPLGNPFKIDADSTRDMVCSAYELYFFKELLNMNRAMHDEVNRIEKLAETNDVALVCYCAPKRCHGDTIKKAIETRIKVYEAIKNGRN